MTSGSHGKPYANWTLPSAVCLYAIGTDGRSSVDEAVLKAVWTRLTDTLAWLFPGQKRIFDEHFRVEMRVLATNKVNQSGDER